MKRYGLVLLLAFLFLTSCSNKHRTSNSQPSSVPAPEISANQGLANTSTIRADYWESVSPRPQAYEEYTAEHTETSVKVLLTVNAPVKDFCFVSLDYGENEDGNFSFLPGKELYRLEEFSPDRPFVVEITFAGLIPDRGVTFVEQDGTEGRYAIQISGKDGSLLLTPF